MTRRVIEVFCNGPTGRRHERRPLAQLVDGRTEPFAPVEPQQKHRDLVARVLPDAPPVQIVGPPRHRIEVRRWTHAKGRQTFALAQMATAPDGALEYRIECADRGCRGPNGGRRTVVVKEQTLERLFDGVCAKLPPAEGMLTWQVDLGVVEHLLRA